MNELTKTEFVAIGIIDDFMQPNEADVVELFHDLYFSLDILQSVLHCHGPICLVSHIVLLLLELGLAVHLDCLRGVRKVDRTKFSSVSFRRASFTTPKEPAPSSLMMEY